MRCKDRLPDLRRRAADAGAALQPAGDHPPHIARILHEAERIGGWLEEVQRNTVLARRLLADPAFHGDRRLQEQLDGTVTASNAAGLKLCGALRQLEAQGAGAGGGGAAGRMARLQAAAARRRLHAALHQQHALLAAARHSQLQLLRQHAHLVNLTLSDEECESLLESDNLAQLFVGNVRAETAAARLALREAEARHAELRRVEAALRDVRELFAQLAALTAAQQDAIDSVEHTALQASDHVGDGQRQLLKGSVTRKRARKKQVSLIICLASGFLLVLLVLVLT
ncbi:syntaxin-like isoform X2 [Pectinophora gossypiella]|uniref:syntaxin-like isoform X2 n=1 Tax=Pectinophora gossypiella TaxID=13191 RepID=UPI00214E5B86|nr:syntaxin-like isoform X2 [Pectinophora gossypiella]